MNIPESMPGSFVFVSVEDTGKGIPTEIMPRIFEPFFSTKPLSTGTGLGLSVAYGVAKQHNGWITVKSEQNKGSVFTVYLPAYAKEPVVEEEEDFVLESYQGRGKRILVVEDELHVRQFITSLLTENGYKVFETLSIKEALQQFERLSGNIDLLFSDVVLPDGSAIDLVETIKSRKPSCRILLSSGYMDEKSQYQVIKQRGFLFLRKPYSALDLLKFIKKALQ
jgi:two-component system, cell cycle sensor histidine kinase and response regulator CckA